MENSRVLVIPFKVVGLFDATLVRIRSGDLSARIVVSYVTESFGRNLDEFKLRAVDLEEITL